MIVVFGAAKGGCGKTTIVSQLASYLPTDTRYLDVDINNGGLMKIKEIAQPAPIDVSIEYLEALLPEFYDEGLLVIDCGGFISPQALEVFSKADKIYTPIKIGATFKDLPRMMDQYLADISKELDHTFKARIFFTDVAWNANREKLKASLPVLPHITPLDFAITSNRQVKDCVTSNNFRVVKEMTLLAEDILYVE